MIWLLAAGFCILGVFVAGTHDFERQGGRQIQKAAPAVRRILPAPVKRILAGIRDRLPIYGKTPVWLVRKVGSVFYFGIVGLFAVALRRRVTQTTLGVFTVTILAAVAMSAIIEAFEFPEEIDDVILDLACGAVGGVMAGLLAVWWLRRSGGIAPNP
ncbi:MAG: hypothetical protein DLM53_03050 [Candidatus Eremiobacter antarcticus]|nr:hypothetical protein [Candidatus Eremiobacteraeota bacterium]MBC5808390.1 hypothetical protein [Candidatus Eremiobacteraeota bacterium]PZR63752.1 MAG: hypothetical protein DLM53_03050 [Candidatus Eremiobacter sp. RRmetagenome_bin22]